MADTRSCSFEDVSLPTENLLGPEEGQGFVQLMKELPQERMIVAVHGVAMMERALSLTIDYVKQRTAFGKKIIEFQNSQFELAAARPRRPSRKRLRPMRRAAAQGRARHRDRIHGEVLDHRHARQGGRPLPAIVRRLWL